MPGKRSGQAWGVFAVVTLLILAVCVALLSAAARRDGEYRALSGLTPTPSAAPKRVSYVYDAQTPSPTALQLGTGAMGQAVYTVQERLRALGYYPYEPDAQFGAGTREAVLSFQRANGLKADGIVGEDTYRLLMSSEAKSAE